ncbi:hypothetical protein VP1G_11107 [Cytospora mali]|uniref:Mediator complex subunit 15 KIX domain-containing protein n=1 Tax=Cytospora mali TaxID=578113 RepID=A0A194V5N2_CYTMA|nr:hypothetical protein VP1G_11107 [Valsa mali var. pyri (nom. inval.)]
MAAPMQQMAGGQLMPQQHGRFAMGGAQGMDFSRIAFQFIQNTPYVGPGWQASVPIAERVGKAQDLITSAVLATPQPNWQRIAQICLQFEQDTFRNSANKPEYDQKMRQKSQEMHARRQGQVPQLQETMNAQAAQQQMMMMNQQRQSALMQAQMAGRGVGPNQQGFQHLQNPMQVSQLPQQAGQMGLNLGNGMTPQASPGQPGFSMPEGASNGGPDTANNE